MNEATIFINEATSSEPIQQIEKFLHELYGVERVLIDTEDGEVKVEFDETKVSKERIIITLRQHNFSIQNQELLN
ncbi:heavy-metal-associated domain-containing protein [Niallia sp. Krafla_26]|uniref:heavy-metal-associated domain-containing protein n=1 Tax=Niallia sp. Krafla_26 TaxID=3064703 RepID=UPI003D175D95